MFAFYSNPEANSVSGGTYIPLEQRTVVHVCVGQSRMFMSSKLFSIEKKEENNYLKFILIIGNHMECFLKRLNHKIRFSYENRDSVVRH
jgi:hypothetical protein